jgi:hypothetical protein
LADQPPSAPSASVPRIHDETGFHGVASSYEGLLTERGEGGTESKRREIGEVGMVERSGCLPEVKKMGKAA